MYDAKLLSETVARGTGYTQEEATLRLLRGMDRDGPIYGEYIKTNAITSDSWGAITLCYGTDVPDFYIKKLGKKKKVQDGTD